MDTHIQKAYKCSFSIKIYFFNDHLYTSQNIVIFDLIKKKTEHSHDLYNREQKTEKFVHTVGDFVWLYAINFTKKKTILEHVHKYHMLLI